MSSILDPSFKYVPAAATDIRKTFARARRELARRESERFEPLLEMIASPVRSSDSIKVLKPSSSAASIRENGGAAKGMSASKPIASDRVRHRSDSSLKSAFISQSAWGSR